MAREDIVEDMVEGLNDYLDEKGIASLEGIRGQSLERLSAWQHLDLNYVVRAVDTAGNDDGNSLELGASATILDTLILEETFSNDITKFASNMADLPDEGVAALDGLAKKVLNSSAT